MKKILTLLLLLVASTQFSQAQVSAPAEKMSERTVLGKWKMVIEMDEVVAELDKKAKESETVFEEAIVKMVSGVMEGVMDRVNIYLEFKSNGTAYVYVDAFDEEAEREETNWYVKGNRLYVEDTDNFESNMKGYWEYKDGVLVLENDDDDNVSVYMVRIDE